MVPFGILDIKVVPAVDRDRFMFASRIGHCGMMLITVVMSVDIVAAGVVLAGSDLYHGGFLR